jgi:N-acetylglucosaminyldiphosphoundecaprenol N-acetyl-beta-D-mannosaminyltransferase
MTGAGAAAAGGTPQLFASVRIAGMPVAAVTLAETVDHVVTVNVDHLQRCQADPAIASLNHEASLVVADGMPLLWAARLAGTPLPERVAGSDLVWLLAERAAAEGRSLFLLGGNPGAAETAAVRLRERWPALRIAGTSTPTVSSPPTASEVEALAAELGAVAPDIVYVALGAPKQEQLIRELRSRLPGSWWMGVGIGLSFIAGDVGRAPRWLQRLGLEWTHRLVQEPRRLARR